MRNPDRIDVFLNYFSELWRSYPNLRFSQVIELIGMEDYYYTEDKEMFLSILIHLDPIGKSNNVTGEEIELFNCQIK